MMYSFVTSMSLKGYEEYGKTFIESFDEHCDRPLYIFSEDKLPVPYLSLHDDPDYRQFMANCPEDQGKDYRFFARRFAHKVFAVTNQVIDPSASHVSWWIWIDADVEVFDEMDDEFLSKACQGDISYLGRKDWHTSECGWVAYNLHRPVWKFLERFREIYVTGELFSHLEWHDSYIFDRVMEELPGNYHNLSEGIPGMHPWDATILGEKMRHLKGPLRKAGRSLEGLPEEYRSANEISAVNSNNRP